MQIYKYLSLYANENQRAVWIVEDCVWKWKLPASPDSIPTFQPPPPLASHF